MKIRISQMFLIVATFLLNIAYGAQQNYYVVSLDTLGGTTAAATSVNNNGLISGFSNLPGDETTQVVMWLNGTGSPIPLGTLGGPNSSMAWPVKNNDGLIVGFAETDTPDPNNEAWSCSFFFPTVTNLICKGFAYQNGVMSALPAFPGGNNSYAAGANGNYQIVGWAENGVHDPSCVSPQVLQFRAAVWGPAAGQMQELPPYTGDSVSSATAINNNGQVVGISGICDIAVGRFSGKHAVMWDKGKVINLADFPVPSWNTPAAINQQGDVVGFANTPGATLGGFRPKAFIWTKKNGLQYINPLSGDTRSIAYAINTRGQVVGQSYGPNGAHAFIWQGGAAIDLNTLAQPGALPLVYAQDINDSGEIIGQAFDPDTGELVPFKATPPTAGIAAAIENARLEGRTSPKIVLPEKVMKKILQRAAGRLAEVQ